MYNVVGVGAAVEPLTRYISPRRLPWCYHYEPPKQCPRVKPALLTEDGEARTTALGSPREPASCDANGLETRHLLSSA